MDRKLASVQRILKLEPISGADSIEKATLLGWNVVVRKGQFKENDLVVYFEVDSIVPRKEWSDFLFKDKLDTIQEFRLRTIRLRGQLSQGIIFPIDILNGYMQTYSDGYFNTLREVVEFKEGEDLTELLGIKKYEAPELSAQLSGQMEGRRPIWFPKTDEVRIQGMPSFLERHKGKVFIGREKIDGSSVSYFLDANGKFGVSSRNYELKENLDNVYWRMAKELNVEEKLRRYFPNGQVCLQGEVHGLGVQKNFYKLDKVYVRFFNLFIYDHYASDQDFETYLDIMYLAKCPVIFEPFELNHTVDQLLKMVEIKSTLNPTTHAEGVVFRCVTEGYDEDAGRLSFKVINNKFLETYKE